MAGGEPEVSSFAHGASRGGRDRAGISWSRGVAAGLTHSRVFAPLPRNTCDQARTVKTACDSTAAWRQPLQARCLWGRAAVSCQRFASTLFGFGITAGIFPQNALRPTHDRLRNCYLSNLRTTRSPKPLPFVVGGLAIRDPALVSLIGDRKEPPRQTLLSTVSAWVAGITRKPSPARGMISSASTKVSRHHSATFPCTS
jgi:hypothetical protein